MNDKRTTWRLPLNDSLELRLVWAIILSILAAVIGVKIGKTWGFLAGLSGGAVLLWSLARRRRVELVDGGARVLVRGGGIGSTTLARAKIRSVELKVYAGKRRVYAVLLRSSDGQKDAYVEDSSTYLTGRRVAEQVARLLWVDLHDSCFGAVITRRSADLDRTLSTTELPAGAGNTEPALALDFGPTGFSILSYFMWINAALLTSIYYWNTGGGYGIWDLAFLAPWFLFALYVTALDTLQWHNVTVTERAFTVRKTVLGVGRTYRVPLGEIEEIRVGEENRNSSNDMLQVISDRQAIAFAPGLTASEATLQRHRLHQAVVAAAANS